MVSAIFGSTRTILKTTPMIRSKLGEIAWNHRRYTAKNGQGSDSLLSKFPCKLAYVTPCKCWRLQNYVKFHPGEPDYEDVRGSLDPVIGKDSFRLHEQYLEIGEVTVSSDGLLHPDSACFSSCIPQEGISVDSASPTDWK